VRLAGMKTCCGGIVGMGETRDQRAGLLHALASLPAHPDSVPILRNIVEAKKMWKWVHHREMRIAAAQALAKADPRYSNQVLADNDLDPSEIAISPLDSSPACAWVRQRRYERFVLHKSLPYDPVRDFVPVALFGVQPNVLVASTQSGFKTVADLVAAAKAKPGTLTFASGGIGSTSHLAAERFRLAANIDVRHIPFREGGLTEVMAGRIDFYFIPLAAAASALSTGKLAELAVSTPKRAPLLPSVPTVAEAGYPNAESSFWVGLSAPASTPREIVNRLNAVVQEALQISAVKDNLARVGIEPQLMSVEQFGKFFNEDVAATVQLARDAHIEPPE